MSSTTPNPPPTDPAPEAQSAEIPTTPEQVMEAAAQRIGTLEAELAAMRDRWMRAEAEAANIRARTRREVDETRQYAVQKFATDIVEAAENVRRGIDSLPAAEPGEPSIVTSLREGLAGIERNFLAVLERNGIAREDPTGMAFDANRHQAMAEQDSEHAAPGTILTAWTPVWMLNGRLLRPAMVVVVRAGGQNAAGDSASVDTTA